jgi:hypothetical protein
MLLLSILALLITGASALGSISAFKSTIVVRQATDPCDTACAIPLNVVANCSTSPDPFCGCSQLLAAAGPCKTCLTQTNSTAGGILNALAIAEAVVICNCQGPSCGDLLLSSRQCQATDPTNPNCTCPAIVKATDCYACLEANDTSIAPTLRGDVSRCQAVLSEASSSSTPSSTAVVSPSKSSTPTATSDGEMIRSVQNFAWFSFVVALGVVYGMF